MMEGLRAGAATDKHHVFAKTLWKKIVDPRKGTCGEVLADAITVDGRKEWICKFCSGSNVWTRAMFLQHPGRAVGKIEAGDFGENWRVVHRFVVIEWRRGQEVQSSGAESKELQAQVEQLRRQQRGEPGQEGRGDPARRESGLEEDWNMDIEEEVENKKKLDEHWRRLQKQPRDLGKCTCMPTFKAGSKKRGSWRCSTFSKSGMISFRSTRECRRGLKRQQTSSIRREICSRKLLLLRKRCGRLERKSMKERRVICSCRVSHLAIGWQQNIWKKNFGSCRQRRKEEVVMLPKPMTAALIRWRSSSSLWERRMRGNGSQFCRKNIEKIRGPRQMGPPAPGGRNEGFPVGTVFDPRFPGANGESGGAGNFNSPYNRSRSLSRSPRGERQPMQEDGIM